MNLAQLSCIGIAAVLMPMVAASQGAYTAMPTPALMRVLNAAHVVENYKIMAAASARVFAARGQGSDAEYAEAMSWAARSDLTPAKSCIANHLSEGLTAEEASQVAVFYESPIGRRLIEASKNSIVETVERMQPVLPSSQGWSEEDKRQLAVMYTDPAVKRFHQFTAQKSFAEKMIGCYRSVIHAQHPNAKF